MTATMTATMTAIVNKQVTPMEILENRKARKEAGMVGCLSRKPTVEYDFTGYRDVQCWNIDTKGRFPDQQGYDYTSPNCFCFDCRGSFDSKGLTDAELVNAGIPRACFVYASLLDKQAVAEPEAEPEGDDDDYDHVEGMCQDCEKKDATNRFCHLDGRSFSLCSTCWQSADHEDDYLAHVEPPRLRDGRRAYLQSLNPGLSNDSSSLSEEKKPQAILMTRTNGGGIEKP
jgi:hypothetical protein